MSTTIVAEPLTREAFAPFGQVIECDGALDRFPINAGEAERFHALAHVELRGEGARAIVSIVRGKPRAIPHAVAFVERHPLGSQAFHPLSRTPFLVVVAPDEGGKPGRPRAFLTAPGQGVNYAAGTWHGILAPLHVDSEFLVVDRSGDGDNCEEHHFAEPFSVVLK